MSGDTNAPNIAFRKLKYVGALSSTLERMPLLQKIKPGVGLPIARACVVLSLTTAAVLDLAIGPYQGKQTGETALLREILDCVQEGDVVVFDRCYCSYMMIAAIVARGAHVCVRLHQCRPVDFSVGQPLGERDRLVTWPRPQRPAWQSAQDYDQTPQTLTLRELQFDIFEPASREETITVVTTMTDPVVYPKEQVAGLYGYRWNSELDIRDIKQTLKLDHARCKTPQMVHRELWVKLLAYNLIRTVIATAAAQHDKQPRQLGFTLACQTILSSWMMLSDGSCRNAETLCKNALKRIAANQVANRPGRIEPRVLKRRRHRYPLMTRPRKQLREELRNT